MAMNLFEDADDEEDVSDEDMALLERSIPLTLRDLYNKRADRKPILFRGNLRNHFFEWLLASIDEEQLILIKEQKNKFSEGQQKKLGKAKPFEYPIEKKESGTIAEYIEKNALLIQENEMLKKKAQEVINAVEVVEVNSDLFKILGWLYDFMNSQMKFKAETIQCPICKAAFIDGVLKVTKEDIERLEEIEEILEIDKPKKKQHTGGDIANIMIDDGLTGGHG